MRSIQIVGGGLAGLSLGIALRRRQVPVTLYEAGSFPRHKVCGEFIAGIRMVTLSHLGIAEHFQDACRNESIVWYIGDRKWHQDTLGSPALGISRYTLDLRLAQSFQELGGCLQTGVRIQSLDREEGVIWANGRRVAPTQWIGLKVHASNFYLDGDLEMHLGEYGYAGATAIEGGRVNVCGLFQRRTEVRADKEAVLMAYLEACSMKGLMRKLSRAEIVAQSASAVTAIDFKAVHLSRKRLSLGDQFAVIPPFTGNGMSMAFEAAVLALDPLTIFAKGGQDWRTTVNTINGAIKKQFALRLKIARCLHPCFYHPLLQFVMPTLKRARIFPFQKLMGVLHKS